MKKKASVNSDVPKYFQCNICQKGFCTSYYLKSHMFIHGGIPARFECEFCFKGFFRSDEYSRHLKTHMKKQKCSYCDHCGRGFIDKRNLIQHLHIHDDIPDKIRRYTCEACGANYCEERLLKYHVRKEHLNLDSSTPTYMIKNLNETWLEKVDGTRNYVEITKVKPTMLRIKKSKLKGENVTKELTKNVSNKVMLQKYIASVFASKNNSYSKAICDYCNKEMLKKSIRVHIRECHLKLARFHCDVCGESFDRHYQLSLHNCGKVRKRRRKYVQTDIDKKKKLARKEKK